MSEVLQPSQTLPVRAMDAQTAAPAQRAAFWPVTVIFVQVLAVALVLYLFGIESSALRRVVCIAAAGFVGQHFVPARFRTAFFAALSIGALVVILGGSADYRVANFALGLERSLALCTAVGVLIVICHLPVRFGLRVGLLLAAGAIAAALRVGVWDTGSLSLVWPVLAAMAMFRVMVYLYDVSTARERPTASQTLSYFFALPNVCTLLFPVVDFRTLQRGHRTTTNIALSQRGVTWMVRGVVHLLLYRAVVLLGTLGPDDVQDGSDLARFVLANSFLYLKVSGVFHLVAGLMLLFGFDLPETNHRYFLAASFTDYWRRVNTYWRAFVMKVFYYPAFFRLRRLGQTGALVLATLWTFVITWALHLYQTFWLKGSAAITWPDTIFWSVLALLVLGNSLWELHRGRPRKLPASGFTMGEAAVLSLRTAGTFVIISMLWSLWSTPTLAQWVQLWRKADLATLGWGLAAVAAIAASTVVFEVLPANRSAHRAGRAAARPAHAWPRRETWTSALTLAGLGLVAAPWTLTQLASLNDRALPELQAVLTVVLHGNARGQGHGYYENLTTFDDTQVQLADTFEREKSLPFPNPIRMVASPRLRVLEANVSVERSGVSFHTNRWGMRDRDYALQKPAHTVRIALLGSSHVMGYGLSEQDMFEQANEERLNAQFGGACRIESLNFAVGGQSPLGQIADLHERVSRFAPDVVVYVAHLVDFEWTNRDLVQAVRRKVPLPSAELEQAAAAAKISPRTNEEVCVSRLRAVEPRLLALCYRQMVAECRAMGALPVCVFLPLPNDLPLDAARAATLLATAHEAGFVAIDLSNIYAGIDPGELSIPDAWRHCNPRANALIGAALYRHLATDPHIDLSSLASRATRMQGTTQSANRPRQYLPRS